MRSLKKYIIRYENVIAVEDFNIGTLFVSVRKKNGKKPRKGLGLGLGWG